MKETKNQWVTRQTLLLRVKNRSDDQAWADFELYYRQYLYNILRRMNITVVDAEDISQQVLLKMWEKLPEFKLDSNRGKFRSWLATVVRNQAINYIKKNNRHEHQEISTVLPSDSQTELEQIIEKEWQRFITEKAWEVVKTEFEEKTLAAFELFSSGLSVDEVALKLNLSVPSVYSFKNRVKERFKNEIRRLSNEYG